jgi:hypothetical protein
MSNSVAVSAGQCAAKSNDYPVKSPTAEKTTIKSLLVNDTPKENLPVNSLFITGPAKNVTLYSLLVFNLLTISGPSQNVMIKLHIYLLVP